MTIDTKQLREKVTGKNVIEIAAAINYGTFLQLLDEIDRLREQLADIEIVVSEFRGQVADGDDLANQVMLVIRRTGKRVPELEQEGKA